MNVQVRSQGENTSLERTLKAGYPYTHGPHGAGDDQESGGFRRGDRRAVQLLEAPPGFGAVHSDTSVSGSQVEPPCDHAPCNRTMGEGASKSRRSESPFGGKMWQMEKNDDAKLQGAIVGLTF